jgi:hypothetical protein
VFASRFVAASDNGATLSGFVAVLEDVQSGAALVVNIAQSTTIHDFTGLPSGRNWTVAVAALNAIGSSANRSAPGVYTTHDAPQVCNEPFWDSIPGLDRTTSIFVNWIPPFANGLPILDYALTIDADVSPPGTTVILNGTTTQYIHMNLIPGQPHSYSLRARNAVGEGAPSTTFNTQTDNGRPATPPVPIATTILVSGHSRIELTVQHSAYSGILNQVFPDFYEVEEQQSESISVSAEGFATTALLNITSSTLPMLLERLRLNTQNYRYRVRARTSVGTSDFSNFVIVPNDFSGVPTEPSSVQITPGSITPTSVRVEWLLPAIGKNTNVSFQIRMTPNTTSTVGRRLLQAVTLANGESRRLQALGEGVIQSFEPFSSCTTSGAFFSCAATVTGMRPSFTYLVQLFAQNAIGSSLASDATESPVFVTMLPGPPELPTDFAVIGVGRYHLDFSFRVPRDNGRPIAGYLLDLGRGIPPTGHGVGASLLPGSSSCADVVAAWLAQGGGSQVPRLEGSTLSISATFLPSGVSYNVSLQACNDVGASPYGACACADPICDPHCVSTPLPAHTHAPPDAPDTPTQVQNLNLEFLKPRQLFVTWRQPFDHYSPILETNLTIENTTFLLAGDITAFNVSELSGGRPLTPATQYPATLCMRNAYGYGAGCDATQFLTWLSTTPDVPEAPPRPECDPNANTHTQLYIRQQAATDNGVPVSEYVVNVTNMAGSELFVGTIDPNIGFLIVRSQDVALHLGVPADVVAQQAGNVQNGLLPGTSYKVTTRARNALGWSVSSQVGELCSTRRAPTTPFNWVPIVVALIVTLVLFIAFVIAWRCAVVAV